MMETCRYLLGVEVYPRCHSLLRALETLTDKMDSGRRRAAIGRRWYRTKSKLY